MLTFYDTIPYWEKVIQEPRNSKNKFTIQKQHENAWKKDETHLKTYVNLQLNLEENIFVYCFVLFQT